MDYWSTGKSELPVVRITGKGMRWQRTGHPWLYRDDLAHDAKLPPGELAAVLGPGDRFLGQAFYLGLAPQELLAEKIAEILANVGKVLGDAGAASGALIPDVVSTDLQVLLERLLPGLMVANMGLVAWLNVVLARQLHFLLGWGEPKPPLYQWVAPEWLIFALLGSGFLLLVPVSEVRSVGLNVLLVLALLYFAQGLAVVATWFQRLGLPKALRIIGYPLMFLNPVFFVIITLGLMDLWLDFRRLHRPKES